MSSGSIRRWLWIVALVTMPVPYYLAQLESAPVLRLGFLTSLYGLVALAEGGRSVVWISLLGLAQIAVYTGLFFGAASLAARAVARISSPPLQVAAVGTAVFLLVTSALLPIYETPLSSRQARSNLWQMFQ